MGDGGSDEGIHGFADDAAAAAEGEAVEGVERKKGYEVGYVNFLPAGGRGFLETRGHIMIFVS